MSEPKRMRFDLNRSYCKACGICYNSCPKDVLAADENGCPQVVNAEACVLCKMCEYRCPDFAIRVEGI